MNGAVTVSSRPGATMFMLDLPAESVRGAPVRRRRRLTPHRFHVETDACPYARFHVENRRAASRWTTRLQ